MRHDLANVGGLGWKRCAREANSPLPDLGFCAFTRYIPWSGLFAPGRANHLTVNSFGEVRVSDDRQMPGLRPDMAA